MGRMTEYQGYWEPTEDVLKDRLIELGKQINDLTDEIVRLRAFMPAQVLREYERRYEGGK